MNVIDARWIDTWNGLYIDITGLSETDPDNRPGVWRCKNDHEYKTDELWPMRETSFEGVQAKAPFDYEKILEDEYRPSALTKTDFNGYVTQAEQDETTVDHLTDTTGTRTTRYGSSLKREHEWIRRRRTSELRQRRRQLRKWWNRVEKKPLR